MNGKYPSGVCVKCVLFSLHLLATDGITRYTLKIANTHHPRTISVWKPWRDITPSISISTHLKLCLQLKFLGIRSTYWTGKSRVGQWIDRDSFIHLIYSVRMWNLDVYFAVLGCRVFKNMFVYMSNYEWGVCWYEIVDTWNSDLSVCVVSRHERWLHVISFA